MTRLFSIALFYLWIVSCSNAQSSGTGIKVPGHDQERLLINNLNLTAAEFKMAYYGADINQRRLAEMYLIGVLDASEGKQWCGYDRLLSVSIADLINVGFRKADRQSLEKRASDIMLATMAKYSPCKEKKSEAIIFEKEQLSLNTRLVSG